MERREGLFKFRKSWCFSFIRRCTHCDLHSLSFTFSTWNLNVVRIIYCTAFSDLKRLPVQSCLLSASSLMSDGIKEQRHHFIFSVYKTLWYFKAYTSILVFSQQQEKSSQEVVCATRPSFFKVFPGALSWAKKKVQRQVCSIPIWEHMRLQQWLKAASVQERHLTHCWV